MSYSLGAEKGTLDLIIRAFNEGGILLVESDIHFNSPREAVVNLTISKSGPIAPSEYELLNAMLTPEQHLHISAANSSQAAKAIIIG